MASKWEYVEVRLGIFAMFEPQDIIDLSISSSIKDMLPRGSLIIADRAGLFWTQFNGLAIGSEVNVTLISENHGDGDPDEQERFKLPTFYVTRVQNAAMYDLSLTAGNIVVEFAHPWSVFFDSKSHAYKPQKLSNLVKEVLLDETRGVEFKIDEANFKTTDDDGKVARYKCGETDFDFLINKVLPYCCINEQAAHLFCRDDFHFVFSSFITMYQQQPKAIFGPEETMMSAEEVAERIAKAKEDYSLDDSHVFPSNSISMIVGDDSQIRELHQGVVMEQVNNNDVLTGEYQVRNALGESSSERFANILPFDAFFGLKSITSTKVMNNRSLSDAVSLFFNSSKVLDNMFTVVVGTIGLLGDDPSVQIGDTVELVLPDIEYGEDAIKKPGKYINWMSGKWLVTKMEHMKGGGGGVNTRTYLSRPCFVGDRSTTSLLEVDLMYRSKG